MTLTYLSGEEIGRSAKGKARQAARKESKAKVKAAPKGKARREVRKAEGRGVVNVIKKVAKVQAAPVRLAFLAVVAINLLKTATKLAEAYKKNPTAVQNFWKKFGGQESALKTAIEKGSKSKLSGAEIGNPAAILAAATPVLIAVAALFKNLGIGTGKGEGKESDIEAAIQDGKVSMLDNPDVEKGNVEMPENAEIAKIKQPNETDANADKPAAASFATGTIDNVNDLINFIKAGGVVLLGLSFYPKLLIIGNVLLIFALCYGVRKKIKNVFNLLNLNSK